MLKSLPSDTVRLIGSSQVITSVYSVVKELTENAFDADCTSLEVKLENYGLDKVEVRDNGFGIKKEAIPVVAKRHHTSKISSFSDLECLETYGFRGEALGSLCAVSTLSITSKTAEEDVSHTYTFDNHGNLVSQLPSHFGQGTTISAVNIFKNMPVRRQFYNTVKKKKEELKKIEDLLMAYGAIRPDVRIVLRNNKEIVWQKSVHTNTRNVLLGIFGRNAVSQMEHKVTECSDSKVLLEAYLPKGDSEVNVTSRSTNDRCFLAINKRPVQLKEIDKIVKQHYCQHKGCDRRHPVFYISITVPSREIDVNVDPNKTKVMLHQQTSVMQLLTSVLEEMYGPVQKLADPEKMKVLDDSALSDLSSDSSFDSTFPERVDFTGRHCLKEKNSSHSGSGAGVKGRLPSVTSDRTKDKVQSSDDGKNCEKACKIDTVSNGSDKSSDNTKEIYTTGGNDLELGNKLVVYHTGSMLSSNSDGNTVNSKSGASEEKIEDKDSTEFSEGEVVDCSHSCKETGNVGSNDCFQTQTDKGNFDILDDDLEELLKTQNKTVGTSDGTTEIFNNTDDMLAELDITLVGDIGEVRKKADTSNTVKGVNVKDGQLKETDSERDGMTRILDWSKGRADKDVDGESMQPVQLLTSGSHVTRKRPASPNQDLEMSTVTPLVKRKSTESLFDQPKLYDIVAKSPAEKYPLGVLAFSKEMRPKVLEDNPDLSYDEVTAKVRQQWQQLPDLDKRQFDDTGKIQIQDLKKKVSERKRLAQKLDKRLQVNGTPSIKDQLLASSKKSSEAQNVAVKSMKLPFCLQTLQQLYMSGLRQIQTQLDTRLKLIGPLKFYNGWMCCHGNELQVINPHRVEETLLYRELMENHIIPANKLDNTIGLTESSVGGSDLYGRLLEMVPSNTAQTYVYIEDKRLKANGIEIRCHMDQDSSPVLEIVGLATCMPMYGVRDLQEILELIVNSGASTVYQARPLKVSFYLQGEAVRMVRQKPIHRSREDMSELLEQMDDSLSADCVTCLHNKPFKQTVYNINSIPDSQTIP